MSHRRWIAAGAGVLFVSLGATIGYSLAQENSAPTVPFAGGQVELQQARNVGRQMQVQSAVIAGYPLVGARVEVCVRNGFESGVPKPFDPGTTSAPDNFLFVGKLAAFDANWVGIEGRDGSKIYLPREGVSQVHELPAATSQPVRSESR